MNKRILSLLIAVVMVVGLLPMAAFAVDAKVVISVEANKTSVDQGEDVTFTVYAKADMDVAGIQLYVDAPAGFTYKSGSLAEGVTKESLNCDGDVSWVDESKQLFASGTTNLAISSKTPLATFVCTAEKAGSLSVTMTSNGADGCIVAGGTFDEYNSTNNYGEGLISIVPVTVTVNKTSYTASEIQLDYTGKTLAIADKNFNGTAAPTTWKVIDKDDAENPVEWPAAELAKAEWSVDKDWAKVEAGVVSITDVAKAVAGDITVTVKIGGETKTATVAVTKAASAVTEVLGAANNPTTALIPTSEDSVDYTYAVDVLDQYGAKMTGETVTWAVEGDLPTGVTFDATTAKLTVAKTAESGPVVLKATVDTKTATINVNVTNISFTGVDEGVKASDGVYGAKLSDLVKIDASKITATAGATVAGKYTLKDADTVPAAADEVAYEVVFNSNDETYKDIPVASGTVKVAPKEIVVTAKDVTVRVRTDVADVKAEYGYENTELVGDDELTGTPGYTLYALNEDGTVSSTVVTLNDEVMEQPAEFALVVAGLDVPNANYTITFSNAGRLEIRKKSLGIPEGSTKPDDPNKDPDAEKLVFDDVVEGDWFYDAVNYVAENKLMNGTAEKTFAPHANTSRAMIATILWRQAGSPEPRARIADFPDVVDGSWYADAVRWCAEKEIVTGYEDGTFGPDNEITREQLAAMLYRYAGSPEVDAAMGMAGFEDVETISAWAADAMRWAVQNGIMNGKNGTLLDPQGLATRAETAAMFQRYLSKK